MVEQKMFTRRQFLTYKACEPHWTDGSVIHYSLITEAVSSVALEHPEWDMDNELHTWDEWENRDD